LAQDSWLSSRGSPGKMGNVATASCESCQDLQDLRDHDGRVIQSRDFRWKVWSMPLGEKDYVGEQVFSRSAVDWQKVLPSGWTIMSKPAPGCFTLVGLDACLIRPLARGHLEPMAPLETRHVLVSVPKWAISAQRIENYNQTRASCSSSLCKLLNVVEEEAAVIMEFDAPQGASLEELGKINKRFDEQSAQICCYQLLRVVRSLHRNALWMQGCIHCSTVFVGQGGVLLSVVPWGCLLSSSGLAAMARALKNSSCSSGIAPECVAALRCAEAPSLAISRGFRAVADVFAVASLMWYAIVHMGPDTVSEVAKSSSLSSDLFDFFVRATYKSPDFRLDVQEALHHRWLVEAAQMAKEAGAIFSPVSRSDTAGVATAQPSHLAESIVELDPEFEDCGKSLIVI